MHNRFKVWENKLDEEIKIGAKVEASTLKDVK